ncbi:MAG TPA: bifunctional methylenetetrahydrofolate dehydrogenase/methenyltetrahydrofolate cyclohydrolase [Polyangiaceae bacterium]|nr:bifunctional methylenetetrahydrofolate dehydrogenase/methenyltetrahydrofolate cyclohydrolase [Polyangiaceae bacterium]
MTIIVDPSTVAAEFRKALRKEIAALPTPLRLLGLISGQHGPAHTYAEYTRRGCEEVGVSFELKNVARLEAEASIAAANADPDVHGVLIYYPVFGTEQDRYLRDSVDPGKDIEGLHSFWSRCLYENRRFIDAAETKKAILPCTPLAVLKLLEAASVFDPSTPRPLEGKRVCIFNRSEVVGRPLASMMANDGAHVVSFDVDGPQLFVPGQGREAHSVRETEIDRRAALADADIVVTGVPTRSFERIAARELAPGAVCVNFSTFANFENDVKDAAKVFVPRVGPMTVTMALRNTLRLYQNGRG